MKILSIDIETTSLDPEVGDVLEIGAVVEDLHNPVDTSLLPAFHCYVVKNVYKGEPYALSMHPVILRRIAKREKPYTYLEEANVYWHLKRFLGKHFDLSKKIVVAGKNYLGFDKLFLDKLPNFKVLPFHHRVIDLGNLYWDISKDEEIPSTKECMTRAGLTGEVAHTAVEDAIMVVKLLRQRIPRA